jgi:hypothetical protein
MKSKPTKPDPDDRDIYELAKIMTTEEKIELADELERRARIFRALGKADYKTVSWQMPARN